ncbi:CCR4-NOT transcription complex subunit 1, CAF1-binding domain,CCR4-NOT transcription complex subunit 1 [Cinara cedri]|uniref:CCR4-NOT transcription complex subunit 1, CAF1-binding domain,CCR4-NOT transcription complex subunit 1 n=1 Tax=Cinara cedri TaxID=506608 RepID=A0A5E4NSZ0_9HEMI|nr:CCR4-NOT transcription complex subunit 1, CAF1-binding domain,CCR4-NOT transcription complex subunit 1 [Cinara cedri]
MVEKMSTAERITKVRFWRLYYSAVIQQTNSVDDVIHSLEEIYYKPKGKEIMSQMLDHLFGQYQYFSTYKRHELILAGRLYGGIIERGIIENDENLRTALYFVLESLKQNNESDIFAFGLTAVDQFCKCVKTDRVRQYLNYMLEIPNVQKHVYEHLIEKTTKEVLSWSEEFSKNMKITQNTGDGHQSKRIKNIVSDNDNVGTKATKKNNKESVHTKMIKILKDLNQFNVQTKCDEIQEILTDEYLPWLSRYLLTKRIAVESNFHEMYLNFLEGLNNIPLNTLIRRETVKNIRVLFKQNKSNSPCVKELYRTRLNNLGHWFGMITIAENRSTVIDEFGELDSFLTKSYNCEDRGEFAIPFVVKVLESCAGSKVYNTQHPWTIKALTSLTKLYHELGVYCMIRFQIEHLFKILNVKLEDFESQDH